MRPISYKQPVNHNERKRQEKQWSLQVERERAARSMRDFAELAERNRVAEERLAERSYQFWRNGFWDYGEPIHAPAWPTAWPDSDQILTITPIDQPGEWDDLMVVKL